MVARIAGRARAAARAAGFAGWTAAMLAGVELAERAAPPEARRQVFEEWMRRWSRGLLRLFGVALRTRGEARPAARGAARLVVSNHRSPIDIAALLSVFGGHVLSRADLAEWPIVGRAARKADTIFVDRDSRASGASAVRAIRARLRAGGTVTVFPEGTTFAGDEVRPLRGGAFVAARGIDVELLPVGLAYEAGTEFVEDSFLDYLARIAARPRLCVGLAVGTPRRARGTVEEMAAEMQREVQALVGEARALVARDLG